MILEKLIFTIHIKMLDTLPPPPTVEFLRPAGGPFRAFFQASPMTGRPEEGLIYCRSQGEEKNRDNSR
jgi:hypothetical protein